MSWPKGYVAIAAGAVTGLTLVIGGCDGSGTSLTGSDDGLSLAGAAQTDTEVVHFVLEPFIFNNPCTGEDVEITGRGQQIVHTTTNRGECPECGAHFKLGAHLIATAVGLTTGETWITRGPLNITFNSPDPFDASPSNESFVSQGLNFISRGPGDNFIAHFNGHVVTNANGDITAEFEHAFAECRG